MKRLLLFTAILLFVINLFSQDLQLLSHFGRNKGGLKAYTYVPKDLNETQPFQLVVVLHGCNQTAKSIAVATGWNKLADSLHFMVLYPEQRQINNVSKCFNFFIPFRAKRDKGEVASIKSMIDFLLVNNPIDKSKIFITGLSAGGAMTNAMLNAYPELFSAGAMIEAPSILVESLDTVSKAIPRVAILQGRRDVVVLPRNADALVQQWAVKNKIDTATVQVEHHYLQNEKLTLFKYANRNGEVKIEKLLLSEVGHRLCVDPGEDIQHGGKCGLFAKDIDFFSTYWIAEFFGLVPSRE